MDLRSTLTYGTPEFNKRKLESTPLVNLSGSMQATQGEIQRKLDSKAKSSLTHPMIIIIIYNNNNNNNCILFNS